MPLKIKSRRPDDGSIFTLRFKTFRLLDKRVWPWSLIGLNPIELKLAQNQLSNTTKSRKPNNLVHDHFPHQTKNRPCLWLNSLVTATKIAWRCWNKDQFACENHAVYQFWLSWHYLLSLALRASIWFSLKRLKRSMDTWEMFVSRENWKYTRLWCNGSRL